MVVARWFRPWARSGSLGAPGLVVRTQVDGLGVVVTPGCESVIASALAWTPVYLDLHPAHLGDTGRKKERWPRGLFFIRDFNLGKILILLWEEIFLIPF